MPMQEICNFCQKPLKNCLQEFLECSHCKVLFFKNYRVDHYEDDYFESSYKDQYGRTYIEDKPNLQKRMKQRLEIFREKCGNEALQGTLLEIGSAAGFFLELAASEGLEVEGWEVSRYMTDYANQNGTKTVQGDFLFLIDQYKKEPFDMVAAFYVIEHFSRQKFIWEGLSRMVKPGGFLLLSLPSLTGPLFWFHKQKWVQSHPADHFVDFGHQGIKNVSSLFGFRTVHIEAEGLHPDRFPLGKLPYFRNILSQVQKTMAWSDTMFVILQKTETHV